MSESDMALGRRSSDQIGRDLAALDDRLTHDENHLQTFFGPQPISPGAQTGFALRWAGGTALFVGLVVLAGVTL